MQSADNGAAIIDGKIVLATEVKVLRAMVKLGRPVAVMEIYFEMKGSISTASLYSLLRRLRDKRSLVTSEEVMVEPMGLPLRRVAWSLSLSEVAIQFLKQDSLN